MTTLTRSLIMPTSREFGKILAREVFAYVAIALFCVDVVARIVKLTFQVTARKHLTRENIEALMYYSLVIPVGGFLYLCYETLHLAVIS